MKYMNISIIFKLVDKKKMNLDFFGINVGC